MSAAEQVPDWNLTRSSWQPLRNTPVSWRTAGLAVVALLALTLGAVAMQQQRAAHRRAAGEAFTQLSQLAAEGDTDAESLWQRFQQYRSDSPSAFQTEPAEELRRVLRS